MKKIIILLLITISLTSIAFFGYKSYGKKGNSPEIKTVEVKRGDLTLAVEATGSVEPKFKVEVKSKASGEIIHFPFEEGDTVKRGDLLLKVDKSDEERNVAREDANILTLRAKLGQAKAALDLQKIEYETSKKNTKADMDYAVLSLDDAEVRLKRKKELFNEKLIARESLDEGQTAYDLSKTKLEQAKARMESLKGIEQSIKIKEKEIELIEGEIKKAEIALEQAKERLRETEVAAPLSGIIIEKRVEKGQIISSGISTVTGGTHLATIADMSSIFVVADVDETDIGKVKAGQEVKITTDAYTGRVFHGRVDRIAPMGVAENRIIIFKVRTEVTGEGRELLKTSMTANVQIIIETKENVLQIPDEAIREGNGSHLVYVMKDGNPEMRKIKKGIGNGMYSEITEGVAEGERVVISGFSGEKNNQKTVSQNPARGMRMLR
ncbi:MAG: efflux RND transporter periplasmic adaptor subunit [Nitrospinae bacterium]|nr:efflux RND transporter periplasmic adaptor subunit [Nitrospinota bacterium]MBI3813434.1 efflux RND transporter periplasmic adaptor subunit [Nitrospinota bacterium]